MCSKKGSDQAKGNQGLWVKKEKESPHTAYFCIILLFCSTHFVSRVSLWLWKRRRKSFLNNNIHLPWERWSRRLSKKLSYFIALRHYSFPWHIMFLIKIACELIKIFTRALPPPPLAWVPCYSWSFLVKLSFILTLLPLSATALAESLYTKLTEKNLIYKIHYEVARGKGSGQRWNCYGLDISSCLLNQKHEIGIDRKHIKKGSFDISCDRHVYPSVILCSGNNHHWLPLWLWNQSFLCLQLIGSPLVDIYLLKPINWQASYSNSETGSLLKRLIQRHKDLGHRWHLCGISEDKQARAGGQVGSFTNMKLTERKSRKNQRGL